MTVLAREVGDSLELDTTAEAELLLSLAEADRGELIPAEDVLQIFQDTGSTSGSPLHPAD